MNLKFYLETGKILTQKTNFDIKECQNKLFLMIKNNKTIKKKLNINNIYNVKKHIDDNFFKNSKKHNNGLKLNCSSGNFHYIKNIENNKIDFLFNNMKMQLKDKKKLIENKSLNKVHNKNKTSPLFINTKNKDDKEKIINGGV